jgi:hypothetical protein
MGRTASHPARKTRNVSVIDKDVRARAEQIAATLSQGDLIATTVAVSTIW